MSTRKPQSRARNGQFAAGAPRKPRAPRIRPQRPSLPQLPDGSLVGELDGQRVVIVSDETRSAFRRYAGPESFVNPRDRALARIMVKFMAQHPEYDGGDVIAVAATRLADNNGEHLHTHMGRAASVYGVVSGLLRDEFRVNTILAGE